MLEPVHPGDRTILPDLTGSMVGRFLIEERLGQGGMGEVYRAEDSMLRRAVAIKRIAPQLSADQEYRTRLLREAERASSLSNQHVAVVHDVLEDKGSMFLVMEYVDGQTLRQKMQQPLTLEEFYLIAEQCVQGIAAAHQRGILHCDIKPENIMIDPKGQVKILDFGLAKQLPRDPEATLEEMPSTTGTFSGTLAYMAPEVLLERPAEVRSDIFSLGVVFYEILANRHPFRVESFIGTTDRILREAPEPLEGIPPPLECLVFKMLAKDAAERQRSADEVMRELSSARGTTDAGIAFSAQRWRRSLWRNPGRKYLLVGMTLVVLLVAAGSLISRERLKLAKQPIAPMPGVRQLAVLPFQIGDADTAARAYGLGLTETLTSRLAELSAGLPLQVVSPGDIRAQSIRTAEQARMHYGANLVLEGTVARAGSTTRIHYTLVNPEDRRVLRAGMVSGDVADPFGLEDRVVQSILRSLEVELAKDVKDPSVQSRTHQPEAYDFYLRGRGYLQEYDRPENIDNAIQVFQRSLGRDPKYALAYAGLGESYRHKYDVTKDAEWMRRGQESCRKAAELAPLLPDGHVCLGIISTHTGRYEEAVLEFRKALEVSPGHDQGYVELALALERLGRFDEAEATYKNAVALRPQYWSPHNRLGRFYLARGRYPEAIDQFEQVVALAPDSFRGYSNLGAAFLMTGRYADAIPRLEKSFAIRPNADAASNLGSAYFYARRFEEAAQAHEKAAELNAQDYLIVGNVAEAYYWMPGRRELARKKYREAIMMAKKALAINANDELALRALALYSAMEGDRGAAQDFERRAQRAGGPQSRDPESSLNSAIVHAHLADPSTAFRYLQEAIERGLSPQRITQSPDFDHLRSDPRMQALLSNLKTERGREEWPRKR
jgi:eukaryotic-like serine/threonine-protein kinase